MRPIIERQPIQKRRPIHAKQQIRERQPIQAKPPRQPHLQEVDPIGSSTLNVLSHLAQTRALRPRKRNFSPRIDLQNPFTSESRINQLPLEPAPKPLPVETFSKSPHTPFQQNPSLGHSQEFVPYRPRPEGRPQRIHRPVVQKLNLKNSDEHVQIPAGGLFNQEEKIFDSRPTLDKRPFVYEDGGTIFRKHLETPTLTETPEEHSSPLYSPQNPLFYQETAKNREPIPILEKPFSQSQGPTHPYSRRTKHRNRPQYSGEHSDIHKPEIKPSIFQPLNNHDIFLAGPEAFESTREKEQPKEPLYLENKAKKKEENVVIYKESTRDFDQNQWRSDKPIIGFDSRQHHRKPHGPPQNFDDKIPLKVLKKKKVTQPSDYFSQSKDFKKDKRAIFGAGHLDKNGIEVR